MKKWLVVLLALMGMMLFSGCIFNESVNANQMGIKLDGGKITDVVTPGIVNDWGFFTDLVRVDVDTQTFSVEDAEVFTSDNQAVGEVVTIQARRKSDRDSITKLYTNWASLVDNGNMVKTISATAKEAMKNGTRSFNLEGLLNDRNGLSEAIKKQLQENANAYNVEIVSVTIENVALDQAYTDLLKEKALVKVKTDKALQEQTLINQEGKNQILQAQNDTKALEEKLNTTKAQTAIEVEIAKREGTKVAAQNQVYVDNQYAYELKKLELMQNILGKGTIYFIPEGTNLNTFMGNMTNGTVVVPQQAPAQAPAGQ